MNNSGELVERIAFLARVVARERAHLEITDRRLFAQPFTVARAEALSEDVDDAERTEAFVSRFSRMQDTVGDKLLALYMTALGEASGPAVDRLDGAERLGVIPSAEDWFVMRRLRNRMVHEYIEDPQVLADALQQGHRFVPVLFAAADRILEDLKTRGWL